MWNDNDKNIQFMLLYVKKINSICTKIILWIIIDVILLTYNYKLNKK